MWRRPSFPGQLRCALMYDNNGWIVPNHTSNNIKRIEICPLQLTLPGGRPIAYWASIYLIFPFGIKKLDRT